jgi:multiple sugar transport system permease protein
MTGYSSANYSKKNFKVSVYLMLSLMGIIMAIPFIWMLVVSFDKTASVVIPFPPRLIPKEFSFYHYIHAALRLNLGRLYFNSFLVTGGVVLISISSSVLAGYSISKIKFKGWNIALFIFLATMMIPFEATMIPLFLLLQKMGFVNSYMAFYLTAFCYPFGIFLAKQFIDTLPDSMREAAVIDGAGEFKVFLKVYFPLCGTVVVTIAILRFLTTWNDLLWPLVILNDSKKYTIQIGLAMFKIGLGSANQSIYAGYPGLTMAGNIFSIIPVLLIYLFFQRYIVQSIALSGLKQ